jgi:hypothetical protein
MPLEVDPRYIKQIKNDYATKFGSPLFLDEWTVSEIVNEHIASFGRLPKDDEIERRDILLEAMKTKQRDDAERRQL